MKVHNFADSSITKEAAPVQSPVRLCMHIRGVARLDPRVRRSASALNEAGFSVYVVDIESEHSRPAEEDINGMHLKHLLKPDWLVSKRFPWRLVRSLQKLISGTILLMRTRADIYHAHNDNTLLPCYIVAQLRRKPLVFEAHEMPLYPLEGKGHRWAHALITQLFVGMVRRCAGLIVVSSPIVEEMYKRYHITEISLIRNIPPYQVISRSNRLREYLGLSSNIRIVLYQGNLQHDRNLEKLILAAKFLEQGIVIILMGKSVGSTLSELEALAAREEVTDRLKIIPPVPNEELLHWTASADIGINISSPDYSLNTRMFLPNKLFEYLMAGLPVLSSPLPAIIEVINSYDVGWILPSLEPKDIGTKINTMLADHIGLERMQRNALEAVKNELCWEKESQRLVHLYQSIIAKHNKQIRRQKVFSVSRLYNFFRKR